MTMCVCSSVGYGNVFVGYYHSTIKTDRSFRWGLYSEGKAWCYSV